MTSSAPVPAPADDEMLISVTFAVRMSGPLLDAPADALQTQTEVFMTELTTHIIEQHPYADLHGGITVSILMARV